MRDRLLLRLSSDGSLHWLRGGASGAATSVAGPPPRALLADARRIVVLVPTESVLVTQARIGARNRAQLLQAVPYAIEDQLLDPVEDLHFAALRDAEGAVGIVAVARDTMRGWLERLAADGIEPDGLLPDALALPLEDGAASLMVEDARATLRLGAWSTLACTPAELPQWLDRLGSPAIALHEFRSSSAAALPSVVRQQRLRDPLAFLARADLAGPNLLEGEFAPRRRRRGAGAWKLAAVLAAAALLLAFANLGVEVAGLARESARLDAGMRDAVRTAFPDIDAALLERVPPEQLVRERVERGRAGVSGQGALALLHAIGPVIAETRQVQTRGLEYRNGRLEVALHAPDVGTLDRVRERIAAAPGLVAEVTAANPADDGIDGRIRVAPAAAGGAAQ